MFKPRLILFLLIIPAFFFLLKPGYYNMHDDMQMIRQLSMEKCLQDGQIPCRWSPDLGYGYGYPLFNFYPPLPYIVGQTFRLLGFSFVSTIKLTAVLQFIFSALAMFALAKHFFGPLGGLVSALFYTYAPYHSVNIYVRGAMNEAWALVFFPLIYLYSYKIITSAKNTKNIILLSLSLVGLLLSHNPMVLTMMLFLPFWVIFWAVKKNKNIKIFLPLIASGLISLALTAFYTLPVIFESKLVQIETMFENYYHYTVHFVSLYQLFLSSFWGDGPSLWGPNDQMSFSIGYLHWIIPAVILLFSATKYLKTKKISSPFTISSLLASLGLLAVFLTHQRSSFIWTLLPPIQKIQFPWRFLNHAIFLFSFSVGVLPVFFKTNQKFFKYSSPFVPVGLVLFVLLLINQPLFHPLTSGPLTDQQKFSGLAWQNQITSGIYDYLPKTAKKAATSPAQNYIDSVEPQTALNQIYGAQKGSDWSFFNLDLSAPATIYLSQLYYPNFKITDFNKEIDFQIEPELGRMLINLPAGQHQLYLKLRNTPIRTVSNLISLFTWSGLVLYLGKSWTKNKSKI